MTIPTDIAASGPYYPNGVTTVFNFSFKAISTGDVSVVLIADDGTETVVSTASYVVTLAAGDDPGGYVTFTTAPVSDGRALWVGLDPTFAQEINFEDEGPFNQTILNRLADEAGTRAVWLRDRVSRGIRLSRGEDAVDLPPPAGRVGKYLGFDALGALALLVGGDATALVYMPTHANAQQRQGVEKFSDIRSVYDFTSPALADASTDRIFVPNGTTDTAKADGAALDNAYWGQGQLRTADGNKRGKFFSAIKTAPSSLGNHDSIDTAFNGDWSKVHFVIEHRVSGPLTLGQPTSGYVYRPEAMPFYGMMFVASDAGYNHATAGNGGRTGICFARVDVKHYGNGDAVCWNATAFVAGNRAGASNFLAQPAIVLFNGDMSCGSNYVYMNPRELHLSDNGYDVACIGDVINMNRTNGTGGQSCWWAGYRVQSVGSIAVNCILSATGKFNAGIDLSMSFLDFGANKAAISLKGNDRLYFNNASGNDFYSTVFNGDYITYSSGISGLLFVVGGSGIFQITASQVTATVNFVASSLRATGSAGVSASGQLAIGSSTATSANAGSNGAPPAQVSGYLIASLSGTNIKIPYYAN